MNAPRMMSPFQQVNRRPAGDACIDERDKPVRAPSEVRAQGHDLAVVGAVGPFGISTGQQQVLPPHDAVNALVVHRRCARSAQMPIQKGRDPPVSIGRPRRNERGDQRRHRRVLLFVIAPTRLRAPLQAIMQVRSRDAQGLGHDAHPLPGRACLHAREGEPSGRCDCACQVSFLSATCRRPPSGSRPRGFCAQAGAPTRGCGPPSAGRRGCS